MEDWRLTDVPEYDGGKLLKTLYNCGSGLAPDDAGVQNSHAQDMSAGFLPGSFSTCMRVSSMCNAVDSMARAFMRENTSDSHRRHDFTTQPAIACLVTVSPEEAFRSEEMRYIGSPRQYLRSRM